MCGFLAILFNQNKLINYKQNFDKSFNKYKFRGPDNTTIEEIKLSEKKILLGHHRLSIIDLNKRSNQPMTSNDNRYKLIFNGEIYNHLEIRNELNTKFNIKWNGTSDTETLLNILIHYKFEKALEKLVGMFSFVFLDLKNQIMKVARDRAGEKPLYIATNENFIGFASDLNGFSEFIDFKNSISKKSLNLFFRYNYIPTPFSIIENVFKLPHSSFIEFSFKSYKFCKFNSLENFSNSKYIQLNKYWELKKNYEFNIKKSNYIDILKNTECLLDSSVKKQLISDVKVGAFLSGGNDSSLIASYLQKYQKTNTYTIGFEDINYNEAKFARKISNHLGTNHHEFICTKNDTLNVIPDLQNSFSEPFADSSQIPMMIVSKNASRDLKVALSGDGGDELFCGYNRYLIILKYSKIIKLLSSINNNLLYNFINIIPKSILILVLKFMKIDFYTSNNIEHTISKIKEKIRNIQNDQVFYDSLVTQNIPDKLFNFNIGSFKSSYEKISKITVENFMYTDFNTYLPDDILCKVDRTSMFYSLELRSPYLDKDLVNYVHSLPIIYKANKDKSKIIIKDLLKKYLPDEYIFRKKMGFGIPISNWIKKDLKDWAEDSLSKKKFDKHNLINYNVVNQYKINHFNNIENNEHKLWSLIQFNQWFNSL